LIERFAAITSRREGLVARRTRIQVMTENLEKEEARVNQEIISLGSTPETIESDIVSMSTQQKQLMDDYEKTLDEYESKVSEAERALTNPGS
jgi:chromosome segregation ATPase